MRFSSPRDTVFFSVLAFGLLLTIAAGGSLAFFLLSPQTTATLADLPIHRWWFSYAQVPSKAETSPLIVIGVTAAVSLLAALSALRARSLYIRTSSPLVLFFTGYLFTLCLESLRGPIAFFYATDSSMTGAIILSRIVYGGRFAGLLALLVVGLYALEMRYKRYLVLVVILFLVSFAIAAYLPMDGTVFLSPLTFKLGDEQGTWFADIALGVLVAASLTGAAIAKKDRGFYVLGGASALLFAGRELISFFGSLFALAAGFLFLTAGIILFLVVLRRSYGEAASV